jgi:hypothetical protein
VKDVLSNICVGVRCINNCVRFYGSISNPCRDMVVFKTRKCRFYSIRSLVDMGKIILAYAVK